MYTEKKEASLFESLKNKNFTKLYMAQTISLLGDALTWVGLALLAFEMAGKRSAEVLAIALTLRVTAFVLFSPFAGILADKIDRKKILIVTHLFRMVIVGTLPFVTEIWQLYVLILLLNIFNAFFTPTYTATIPMVIKDEALYSKAISLSSGTFQLLGVIGPGVAGAIAIWIGARDIFLLDAASFLIAALIIFFLPSLKVAHSSAEKEEKFSWSDIKVGTIPLFSDKALRLSLLMELVAAIAGALILVNTVGYVKGSLNQTNVQYGWAMSAFGIGATIVAFLTGYLNTQRSRLLAVMIGAFVIATAIIPGNYLNIYWLLFIWVIAGAGDSLVNIPSQTLIANRIPSEIQGRVYGAHFAWSHLWWAFAYPLAGFLGRDEKGLYFLYGGIASLMLWIVFILSYSKKGIKLVSMSNKTKQKIKNVNDVNERVSI